MTSRRLASLASALLVVATAGVSAAQAPPSPAPVAPASPAPADGPAIELAPEDVARLPEKERAGWIAIGAGKVSDAELARGLQQERFRRAAQSDTNTSVGGYGEYYVVGATSGKDSKRRWQADLVRLTLFVAHQFNDDIRAYTEFEFEHGIACASCKGTVEIEQAFVDWRLWGDKIALRAGLILVPMGIINQWHEPPVFHGVVRPKVETVIIPSTWRELGIGFFGQPVEGLRYEIYAMTGLNPLGLTAGGFAPARQSGSFAAANAWAVTGRVEYEPLLGVIFGASGYATDAGPNGDFFTRSGDEVDLSAPVLGWSADARWRRAGLELKALYAEFRMPESEALMRTYDAAGNPYFTDPTRPVPTAMRGGYIEGAYDVLRPFGLSHQLLPFARIEAYSTQASVPETATANPTYSVREYTFGASYRPIQQLVFKADYQLRNRKLGIDQTQIDFGVGYMF